MRSFNCEMFFLIKRKNQGWQVAIVRKFFSMGISCLPGMMHIAPASLLWPQLCFPHPWCLHSVNILSFPTQFTSTIHIFPVPSPKWADVTAFKAPSKSSWRQTTLASSIVHWSSHTVPQEPLWNTSTLPSNGLLPPVSRTVKWKR